MSKKEGKDANALQWAKTLRDLVEVRSVQLDKIKAHLLGRDETGAIREPENCWGENPQVMFERYFRNRLLPWTEDDLKLECEDCDVKREDVCSRSFEKQVPLGIADMTTTQTEQHDLCEKCYQKRLATKTAEST